MNVTAETSKKYQIRGFYNKSGNKAAWGVSAFDFSEAKAKAEKYAKSKDISINAIVLWEPKRRLV